MGLDELVDSTSTKNLSRYRRYGSHEKDDYIWEIIESHQHRFPQEIECDLVEVATSNPNYDAKAYTRGSGDDRVQYLRVAERCFSMKDSKLRSIILHEMVHLYCYQNGRPDISDGSTMFKWLCGQVGCTVNQIQYGGREWVSLLDPFLEDDIHSGEF